VTELSIILPVQNEAEIIEQVFSEIFHSIKKITKKPEFILVENGSSDNSLKVIKKISQNYPNTLWAEAPKGYGWAVLKGLTLAEGKFVCYMDSDGQTNLSTIPKLLEEIKSGKWDLVTVTRQNRESAWRVFTSKLFTEVMALLFNTPKIDINAKPKIFQNKHLSKLSLKSKDSFIDAEFLIKAIKLGFKIKEIPTKTLPRLGGKSTRSVKTYFEFFLNIWRFKFGKALVEWEKRDLETKKE